MLPYAAILLAVVIIIGSQLIRVKERLTGKIRIDRLPAIVFAFVSDPRNSPQWNPRIHEVRPESAGPVELGYRYSYEVRGGGRAIPCIAEVIEYQGGRRIATSVLMGGGVTNVFGYSVAASEGATLLTGFMDARVSLLHSIAIRAIGSRRLGANLVRMKIALEAG